MNEQTEKWLKPDFEEVPSSMECTAYAETLD